MVHEEVVEDQELVASDIHLVGLDLELNFACLNFVCV